jgi:glycerophosphoryl diester phosphodiesterase
VRAGDEAPSPGFYSIAHRAGNNLDDLERALAHGVDAIECDLWHARGRLALRHERKLPVLPVLYDRWSLRWAWGTLSLRRLLREIDLRAELFLDIKSRSARAADAVLALYHDHESMLPRTQVSSQQWHLLDRIAHEGTRMRLFYSVGTAKGVTALLRRSEQERPPAGTSIRHTLLTPGVVRDLHGAGLEVYAWTVNSAARAVELARWGVDGMISDDLEVFDLDARAERAGPDRAGASGRGAGSGARPSP